MTATRESIRASLLDAINKYDNLLLNWATGTGKSYTAILLQEHIKSQRTLICVAETTHIDTWKREYIDHNKEFLLENTTIICYHSLKKHTNIEVDLLINDECHHISEARADYLSTIKAKKVISLSATTNKDERDTLKQLWGPLFTTTISINKAVDMGILVSPTINLIPLDLENNTRYQVIELKLGKTPTTTIEVPYPQRHAHLKKKNILLKILCTEKEKYTYLEDLVYTYKNRYMLTRNEFIKLRWLRAGLDRKKYLSSLKTTIIKHLTDSLSDKRYLCFCGAIAQAELLSPNVLHSKLKAKRKEEILTSYLNKEINSLFVVDMLKEGANIPDIEVGIISQLDGNERSFIQKSGRTLRNKINPTIYIIYIKNTQDEKYLEGALEGINPEFINIINL